MIDEKLVEVLNKGGMAIIPTDTVYGIVCDALNEEAVRNVYNLKKREFNKPMIILVSDLEMLYKYTKDIKNLENELISEYWPGPLTIIFKKKECLPDIVTSSLDEIGVRLPDDADLIKLIKELNKPIIATSANISSEETITKIDQLDKEIIATVDYIKDGGVVNKSSSTIVKVIDNKIKIFREGSISKNLKIKYKDRIN